MTRPRSPTQSEIEHILTANDIDFANFIDYHFSIPPTAKDEEEERAKVASNITTAGNGSTTSAPAPPSPPPPPSDASDTSTDAWADRIVYMYYHPVRQIWLSYPPEGVPRAEGLHAAEEYSREGVQSSKNLFDRLVDLGIRAMVSVKRRRVGAREETAGELKRAGKWRSAGRKLTKRRPEGEDGRTM